MNRQIEENNRRIQEENQRIMEEQNRRLIQEQKKQEKNIQYTWHCVYCGMQIVSHDRPRLYEKCPQDPFYHAFSK
jgi:ribosomal protein L44E